MGPRLRTCFHMTRTREMQVHWSKSKFTQLLAACFRNQTLVTGIWFVMAVPHKICYYFHRLLSAHLMCGPGDAQLCLPWGIECWICIVWLLNPCSKWVMVPHQSKIPTADFTRCIALGISLIWQATLCINWHYKKHRTIFFIKKYTAI